MPTIAKTITTISNFDEKAHVVSWTPILNGDDGDPLEMPGAPERSVQVIGTFGAGGTIVIEGSNDGTTYTTLRDSTGTAISLTAAGFRKIVELSRYIRPRVTAGDGTTSLTALMLLSKKG